VFLHSFRSAAAIMTALLAVVFTVIGRTALLLAQLLHFAGHGDTVAAVETRIAPGKLWPE